MAERTEHLKFEHFRGLPENLFLLQGRNFAVLGTNGKGKSAIVDGVEFLFTGSVSRFIGTNTGSIRHDEAVQHVAKGGLPKVELKLTPSGTLARGLRDQRTTCDRDCATQYLANHPNPDSFILRRKKLMDFIEAQDAPRYTKFVDLLGLRHVDQLQKAFTEAQKSADEQLATSMATRKRLLGNLNMPEKGFFPTTLAMVLERINNGLEMLSVPAMSDWTDLPARLEAIQQQLPEANREQLMALTKAVVTFELSLPLIVAEDVAKLNELNAKVAQLRTATSDSERKSLISGAIDYLQDHPDECKCPVCERPLEGNVQQALSRLKQRELALADLQDAESARSAAIIKLKRQAGSFTSQLAKDREQRKHLDEESSRKLRRCAAAGRWVELKLTNIEKSGEISELVLPEVLETITELRTSCLEGLKQGKAKLEPKDAGFLDRLLSYCTLCSTTIPSIQDAEAKVIQDELIVQRAKAAAEHFSNARETAVQVIFGQIATKVLAYYRKLHNLEDESEKAECTQLELKANSRSANGGLRLVIDFLGVAPDKDPRGFLSEGHLDSLGLCIFLACAKIFNPSGTLLVLDDVLSSIDREHRYRVCELLFEEFSDFQIILTTHDEIWHSQLRNSAGARGVMPKWKFQKLQYWNVNTGPSVSEVDNNWDIIENQLNEKDYQALGGPLRIVLEDFMKRSATKVECRVLFRYDSKYTSGDFFTYGWHNKLRDQLVKLDPDNEEAILTDVQRAFGQGELYNYFSHDNDTRLEVPFTEVRDFVTGLKSLTERCRNHKLLING